MRAFLITLLLLSFNAMAVDAGDCGVWSNPDRDGEGIFFNISNGIVSGGIFTYRKGRQAWYTFAGDQDKLEHNFKETALNSGDGSPAFPLDVTHYIIGQVSVWKEDGTLFVSTTQKRDLSRGTDRFQFCLDDCFRDYPFTEQVVKTCK